jgi:hypothetical protein
MHERPLWGEFKTLGLSEESELYVAVRHGRRAGAELSQLGWSNDTDVDCSICFCQELFSHESLANFILSSNIKNTQFIRLIQNLSKRSAPSSL